MTRRSPRSLMPALMVLVVLPACSTTRPGGIHEALEDLHSERAHIARTHSFSRPDRVRVTHGSFTWAVDFQRRELRGSAEWSFVREEGGSHPLVLDTRGLLVEDVLAGDARGLVPVPQVDRESIPGDADRPAWLMGPRHPVLGRPLMVQLPRGADRVAVQYRTSEDSDGLQWLEPAQTAGGRHPFLFSQAQAILARTFVPCQDTPRVRFTYTAEVRTPAGLEAVMSAARGPGANPPWHFRMPQPIPSYLLALAVGDLAFKELGPRTGVYAEPPLVARAAFEFADTERMMETVEGLYGPYRWGRYDILVLPPSFPFGGMENPRMTFATPTILAGDRSLVSLIAHELAHSWSGNLVTNASWADLWLNEGCTVYLERRIVELLYGRERAEMEAVLGLRDLRKDLARLDPRDTRLHLDLSGRDPDDAFSSVPYEKGYLLMRLLEEGFGRERFDRFFKAWFDEHAFHSRSAYDFEAFLLERLMDGDRARFEELRIQEWIHEPGLPENHPQPHSPALEAVEARARAYAAEGTPASAIPWEAWSFPERLHFLRHLPESLEAARLEELDREWSLTKSNNSEILAQWLVVALEGGYEAVLPTVEEFLTTVGRRKFLVPIYTALLGLPDGRSRALAIYDKARPLYHAIASGTLEKLLGLAGEEAEGSR